MNMGRHDPTVLPNGGEIMFTDGRSVRAPDRIEILPGGMVKAIYKKQHEIKIYPPEYINQIQTHTEHLEDQDGWDEI